MSITNETDRQWQQANAYFQRSYRQGKEMMNQLNRAGLELKALREKYIDDGRWMNAVGIKAGEGLFEGSYKVAMRCIWISNNWIHFNAYLLDTVSNGCDLGVRGFHKYLVPDDEEIDTYEEDFLDIPFFVITDIKVSHEVEKQLLRLPVFEDRQRVWLCAIEANDVASDLPTAEEIREIINKLYPQTPESPLTDDGTTLTSSAPVSLANGAGSSPAPAEAEQAILDRLLKPGKMNDFESGLDLPDEYQCYLCKNWFFADQVKTLQGNRCCYSCRQQLPGPDDDFQVEDAPVYETTLFDEPLPEASGAPPGANGQAVTPDTISGAPTAMTVQDPYDEMLSLARVIFPLLSNMEDVRTYGISGQLRRFIDLFTDIHKL